MQMRITGEGDSPSAEEASSKSKPALSGVNAAQDPSFSQNTGGKTPAGKQEAENLAKDLFNGIWVLEDEPDTSQTASETSSNVNMLLLLANSRDTV